MATLVRFLKHPINKDQIAFFPQLKYGSNGYRNDLKQCYSLIGQHSSCAKEYANECVEMNAKEYQHLLNELIQIGYNLKILNK